MFYKMIYETPDYLDNILVTYEDDFLVELSFTKEILSKNDSRKVFESTIAWLDAYFAGKPLDWVLKFKPSNCSAFQREVTDILLKIPFGKTISYKDIADEIAKRRNILKMSSQAVGGALSKNPICIIIPCHKVINTNKKIGGFTGGIKNKIGLLKHEGVYESVHE